MRPTCPPRPAIAPALAFALGLAAAAEAQHVPDPDAGARLYLDFCAACHGGGAEGDGPMTEILIVPVPDLTGLAARNGGVFPWLPLVHVIDGRAEIDAHGGAMPVFGDLFRGDVTVADAPDGSPVETSARVLDLVEYLRTIQKAP